MIDARYGSYQGMLSSGIICYALVVVGYVRSLFLLDLHTLWLFCHYPLHFLKLKNLACHFIVYT